MRKQLQSERKRVENALETQRVGEMICLNHFKKFAYLEPLNPVICFDCKPTLNCVQEISAKFVM